jgi:hypothetical protein
MTLIERIQAILLKPKDTWPLIENDGEDVAAVYKNYLVIVAAVPAVASFIGKSLVGAGGFGVHYRMPIVPGLVNMVVDYVLSLVMVYVLALVANALAPQFKGQPNMLNAVKLMAYGATAGMLGGIFNLLPSLGALGIIAGLYSLYLIYTGIPALMKAPQEKAVAYTAVLIVCSILAAIIMITVSGAFTRFGGMGMPTHMGSAGSDDAKVSIKVPGADITIDPSRIEAATRRMEEAKAKGDTQAAGKAMGEALSAALGGKAAAPLTPEVLKGYVPAGMGAYQRTSIDARTEGAMGMSFSSVKASYAHEGRELEVKVQDLGALPALAMAFGGWAQQRVDRETQDEVERVYQKDNATIKEEYRKDGSSADISLMLANGVMVSVSGHNTGIDEVRKAVAALDLKALASQARPAS